MRKLKRNIDILFAAMAVIRWAHNHPDQLKTAMSEGWAELENTNAALHMKWQRLYTDSGLKKVVTMVLYGKS